MKKILITRRLLKACEEKASKIFEANFNDNDELYSQSKVIEMSQGCDGLLTSLTDKMDAETINKLPENNKKFLTSHDSLGYMSNRYDIHAVHSIIPNVNSDAGVNPEDLVKAVKIINDLDIKIIFLENETPNKSAETVAEETGINAVKGLSVETLTSEKESYIDFMRNNINIIIKNLNENYDK